MKNINIIGVGGVGLYLLDPLARFLSYDCKESFSIALVDGDKFTEKNKARQRFVQIGYKSKVSADAMRNEFPKINWTNENFYIDENNVIPVIQEEDINLVCVDNYPTRKIISDHCVKLNNSLVIAGGNELTDGNIQVMIRQGGKNKTLPLANEFHPEILNCKDEDHPKKKKNLGCLEEISAPQLVFTNFAVASMMLNALYAFFHNKLDYDEAFFDVVLNCSRTEKR